MDRLDELRASLRRFVDERDWEQFHDPKSLAMAVASEAGELAAILRWTATHDADAVCREPDVRAELEDEIADVGLTLLMLAARAEIDLVPAMERKLAKNAAKYPPTAWRGRAR